MSKCVKIGANFDDYSVSPVVRQTLQHWAYKLTQEDFDEGAAKVNKKREVETEVKPVAKKARQK